MSATREAYIRAAADLNGIECHVGLEHRSYDDFLAISAALKDLIEDALVGFFSHDRIVFLVEADLVERWPGRAYFIETDEDGVGVQVYQPFGMPRNDK